MAMTDEQIERYSRHIILKEVGAKGPKKLLNGKVLIKDNLSGMPNVILELLAAIAKVKPTANPSGILCILTNGGFPTT